MDVRNDGVGARNLVLKLGNGHMGVHDTLMDIQNDGLGIHDIIANVGNDGVRVCDVMVDAGDGGLGVLDVLTNVGNNHICVDRKLGLETVGQRRPYAGDRTHVEDVEDPVEVQLPGPNRILVALRVEDSGEPIPFTLLSNLLLNFIHSSVPQIIVSELSRSRTTE